jgi:hypothetical protein
LIGRENDIEIGFHAGSSELLMLNKKERILAKSIPKEALSSKTVTGLFVKTLGSEYLNMEESY